MGRRGRGEGSIYFHKKSGLWAGVVTVAYDPATRKVKRRTVYGRTYKEALDQVVKVKQDLKDGRYCDPHRTTLGEWFEQWFLVRRRNDAVPCCRKKLRQ